MYYNRRFMVIAKECYEADSVIPIIDETCPGDIKTEGFFYG